MSKRISLRKILAQFLMAGAVITALYALVIEGTDQLGLKPHRKDKIASMTPTFDDGKLTKERAEEIVAYKSQVDERNMKLLITGICLAVFAYGFTIYRKK